MGYFRQGCVYEITTRLDPASDYYGTDQATVTKVKSRLVSLGKGEAFLDDGKDLVVWTMHFTKYVIFDAAGGGASHPGQLQFSAAEYKVDKKAGVAIITVTRSGGSDGAVSVRYATADGTAKAGSDYTVVSGILTFNSGETSRIFEVPVLEDTLTEGSETVNLSLSAPSGGTTLGRSAATLTITDPVSAVPDDSQYALWPGSVATGGVAVDRVWQVKFNGEVDSSTLDGSSIFICRAGTGERHPVTIEAANDPVTGVTTATLRPSQPFVSGGSYELYVSRSVRSKGGSLVAQAIRIPFTAFAPLPDDSRYTLWTGSVPAGVAEDKTWVITFNQEVDPSTLTDTSIFICKSRDRREAPGDRRRFQRPCHPGHGGDS